MEQALAGVTEIFRVNTRLLIVCIAGVSDTHAGVRVLPGTKSIVLLCARWRRREA